MALTFFFLIQCVYFYLFYLVSYMAFLALKRLANNVKSLLLI